MAWSEKKDENRIPVAALCYIGKTKENFTRSFLIQFFYQQTIWRKQFYFLLLVYIGAI